MRHNGIISKKVINNYGIISYQIVNYANNKYGVCYSTRAWPKFCHIYLGGLNIININLFPLWHQDPKARYKLIFPYGIIWKKTIITWDVYCRLVKWIIYIPKSTVIKSIMKCLEINYISDKPFTHL